MNVQTNTLAPAPLPSGESGALRELYLLTDRLYRSQSVDDIYGAALDALQATLQCQRASILLFDAAGIMRFAAWRGLSDHYRAALEGHSPWQAGARDAEPIFVRDIRESGEPQWIRETIERDGIRGLGFIPLMARGEVIGKFMTYYDAPHDFAERDIGVAVHIARQVGFSLERQRSEADRAKSNDALRESEERFRVMCEHAPVMIWMSHPDGSCLYLNRMLRTFWNVTEEDIASFSWGDTMHPDDAPRIGAAMYDAVQRRVPVSLKGRYRNARGEYHTLETDAQPRFSAGGEFLGLIGVNIDVTGREAAELALKLAVAERESVAAEREAVLRQLGEGVIVTDPQGRIVYVNQAAAAIHGTAELNVPVEGYSAAYRLFTESGEPYPAERLPLARAVMNRETVNGERWLIRRRDRVEIAAVGSASPVYRADGSFLGAVLTLRDDTARHAAEQALRVHQERLAAAFKIGRIGIYDYDVREHRAVNWDRLICDIWGIGDDEFLSDEIYWSGVHPDDIPVIEKAVASGLDPDGPRRYQSEYRVTSRRDGKMRWVHVDAAVSFEGREPIRILGTVQDITERKQAEEHIRLLMREVNHRSKNLLAVVQAIVSQTALKGEPKSFARVFRDRIQGLAASHDLLVKNAWEGADLRELACSQLSHFEDLIDVRIFLAGAPLKVSPAAAQALGLALHELATNAGKYGSLSAAGGTVTIAWEVAGEGEGRSFTMSWTEAGGPPVKAPERKGFGTLLIADTTASALEGTVKLDYAKAGLRWTLTAPFGSVALR